ncbi:hypothetical protein ACJZ2D_013226 [Fusarium nematophilum]
MDAHTASWDSFPPEIRLMILRYIIPKFGGIETTIDRGFARPSSLATISREWQYFFEQETFRRIALISSDLPAFAKAVRGENSIRLNHINRLWLRIELTEYTRRIFDKPESVTNITQNNRTFTYAMAALLNALSSWEGIQGGLTLEICAHSPSDQIYHPHEIEIHDDYPFRFEEDLERYPGFSEYRRQKREERRQSGIIRRDVAVQYGMAQRLRGTPLELQPWRNLPNVPIVKGLILPQWFLRGIAFTSLAKLLRESFIALESFQLDRYIGRTEAVEYAFLHGFRTQLMPALPASVERFSLGHAERWDSYESSGAPDNHEQLSRLMAASCHPFTEFRPPLSINVKQFLHQLILGGKRGKSKLQRLCLLTNGLDPYRSHKSVAYLLTLAGRAAKKLPRLRVLELWNSGSGFGCIFRYTQDDSRATITWRAAGVDFGLEPKVIKAWATVASTRILSVERIPLTEADGGGDGKGFQKTSILRHLALRRLMFDPMNEARVMDGRCVYM